MDLQHLWLFTKLCLTDKGKKHISFSKLVPVLWRISKGKTSHIYKRQTAYCIPSLSSDKSSTTPYHLIIIPALSGHHSVTTSIEYPENAGPVRIIVGISSEKSRQITFGQWALSFFLFLCLFKMEINLFFSYFLFLWGENDTQRIDFLGWLSVSMIHQSFWVGYWSNGWSLL